jgi:flagellar biosynthetic protein FliR
MGILDIIFGRFEIFLFVLVRMTGFIIFNPVFGRRNIPAVVRGGLIFVLSVFAITAITSNPEIDAMQAPAAANMIIFMLLLVKEFVFGYVIGLVVNIFFSVIFMGGEIMDMQMGMAMSKMYDPASNVQMPLTGNFYNIALMLLFFMTNSHLTLISVLMTSFAVSPIGAAGFNQYMGIYLMRMFGDIFILSLKLAVPVIAAEFAAEAAIGVLMKTVPQINVFVVGLQLKILAGIGVMIVCAPISVIFFDGVIAQMNEKALEAIFELPG